ncbi:hypothetical protein K7432_011362 [Basidiobolus ranarum]|uniref:Uncharacterized protein n=1 Tax=Basidiobolus ranarum TaxID=34480 RepID=A0ABR2VU02_9FUNG
MQIPPITPVQGPGISPLAYQHSPHMNPYNMDPLILPPPLVPDESTNRHKIPSGHARNHSLPSIRTLPENHDLSLSPLVLKDASSPMVYFPGSASKLMASQDAASPMFLPDPISPSSLKLSSIDQAQKEKIRPRV